ncbi:MAG: molybdopterin-guanine dinucleotide biosynthesis protein B [Planctomycetota bacterium]|jgi:molybdopterin-guanine dinucleotide biosynthesis protein MobB
MLETVLGICGWKNSGKTTLIERILPTLLEQGLSVAVVKHDTHGIEVDRPGKDSDRFYRAGADVLLQGPGEAVSRCHEDRPEFLEEILAAWSPHYDLILVEGHKSTKLPKIWLHREGETERPPDVGEVLIELNFDDTRTNRAAEFLKAWLSKQWKKAPLLGCLLIGGRSKRMGRPKHLLPAGSRGAATWVEHIAEVLSRHVQEVVIAGAGVLPESLHSMKRLIDVPAVRGPMAGILAAMRWNPAATWLVAACDMPCIRPEALAWLKNENKPGRWAVMARVHEGRKDVEPLLAFYDRRSRQLLENRARQGDFALYPLSKEVKVYVSRPPSELLDAWENINTPEELDSL